MRLFNIVVTLALFVIELQGPNKSKLTVLIFHTFNSTQNNLTLNTRNIRNQIQRPRALITNRKHSIDLYVVLCFNNLCKTLRKFSRLHEIDNTCVVNYVASSLKFFKRMLCIPTINIHKEGLQVKALNFVNLDIINEYI